MQTGGNGDFWHHKNLVQEDGTACFPTQGNNKPHGKLGATGDIYGSIFGSDRCMHLEV